MSEVLKTKKIIHFDMDYFYAQVEERDKPELKNKPVAIGGYIQGRGVLCTCNYIARDYGVRSAMPTFKALQLCPDLVLVKPNMDKYAEASAQIFEVFKEYTDIIQSLSLDEAYLDVTDSPNCLNSASWMAMEIKQKVFERTGLTGSAGVSYNKLLSKISSDLDKPNGLYLITPDDVIPKISHFPVSKIWGVGKVTNKKMKDLGIETFKDLLGFTKLDLITRFGSFGPALFDYCRGLDEREVIVERERKSVSAEHTFLENIISWDDIQPKLAACYSRLNERLEPHSDRMIKSVFVKIKYGDFAQTTIESQATHFTQELLEELFLKRFCEKKQAIRLVGVGVKFFSQKSTEQLELF
jgi:DNA polymerase-4